MKNQILSAMLAGMLTLGLGGVSLAQEPDAAPTANVNVTTQTTAPADPVDIDVTAPAPASTSTSTTTSTSDTTVIDRTTATTGSVTDNSGLLIVGGIVGLLALFAIIAMSTNRSSSTTVTRT